MRKSKAVTAACCVAVALLLSLLTSCGGAASTTPTPPASPWGEIVTLGETEQTDAPDIIIQTDQVIAAWIGADERGVHQDMRALRANGLGEIIVLPLPPVHPYAQQVAAGSAGHFHLLWLDAVADETRLFSALVTNTPELERGPTIVSHEHTLRYTALANGDGSLWTVTSGGVIAEPSLYARYIDAAGRPRLEDRSAAVSDADWPALLRDDTGALWLFWLRHSDGQVLRSPFVDGWAENPQIISPGLALNPGDRLMDFNAALNSQDTYLFWNVTRADGRPESWYARGRLDTVTWGAPQRLRFDMIDAPFETGFNTGTAQQAAEGERDLVWARPLATSPDVLPVAGLADNRLVVLYLRAGAVAGYQQITTVNGLLGAPNLLTDRDRHLYLAWAEVGSSGSARLRLTMTRR